MVWANKETSKLLTVGQKAPAFSLIGSTGDTVRLSDFVGTHYVVLIFYPGDETPGCTKQLCAIRDDYSRFEAKSAKVFAVNPGNVDSHRKFAQNHRFQFPLLFDEKQKVAKKYGCASWPMVKRTVFVIDPHGTIIFARRGIPSNDEILAAIPNTKIK